MMEAIRRVSFSDDFRNEVQEIVAHAVETDPERFIERFKALPQSLGGRFVSADTFKETFEQYAGSRESRNLFNTPVHNAAAVLASERLRRLLTEPPQEGKNEVVLLTGSPGAGKTSSVLSRKKGWPDNVHAIYEGQLANPETAITKVEQVLKAGFKPVVMVVHTTPERALDNCLQRFNEVGRGASKGLIARIQGNLPNGLAAVQQKFGDSVELRIWDKRDFEHPVLHRGWENIRILESEGNHEQIRQRLDRHLESRRSELGADAWRQAVGEPPIPDAGGRSDGRNAGRHDADEHRRSLSQGNRKDAGVATASGGSFLDFARLQGVTVDPAKLVADGRIHRADVGESVSGKNDASYLLRENGSGWVVNFKGDGRPVHYRPELARDPTPEELARIEAVREAWRVEQTERHRHAVTESVEIWNRARDGNGFPYLKEPDLPAYGLRQSGGRLCVPMMAVGNDGDAAWVGMQRIGWAEAGQSAGKRFVTGTPTKGAFAVIPIVGSDEESPLIAFDNAKTAKQVVLCEGIGTALAIHHATGFSVIAAMSAQNLPDVANSLRNHLQGDVVIYADNDGEKADYKGQTFAAKAAEILGERARIALPIKATGETPSGYDARDQLRDGGVREITRTVTEAVKEHLHQQQEDVQVFQQLKEKGMEQQESAQQDPVIDESPETRLLREWCEQTDPVREQCYLAETALADVHHDQEKAFFNSLEQRRAEHAAELAKDQPHLAQEHRESLIALDTAKRLEQLQKQQAAERKTMLSGAPKMPSFLEFLEQRAGQDADAAKLLEVERQRHPEPDLSIRGKRTAGMEPVVLEGLTHEIESGDKGSAVHYLRDSSRVMTDRGDRLDVYRMSDREIEAALRLAEQKFDMNKGLVLTGSREFQERAAEIAGRLNLKIQNEDLQTHWQNGQNMVSDNGTEIHSSPVAGGIEQARDPVTEAQAIEQPIDHPYLGAEYALARLDMPTREALQAAGDGRALDERQRAALIGDSDRPALIDEQGRLTEDGMNAYQRMNANLEEDRQMQQQLRTRNIDETLDKDEEKKDAHAEREDLAQERQVPEARKLETRKHDREQQDQGMGM